MEPSASTPSRNRSSLLALLVLFLLFSSCLAARPIPALPFSSGVTVEAAEESCEGSREEDECLMRRTLAAHIDYIYTQKKNN